MNDMGILIVDDYEDNIQLLEAILRKAGFTRLFKAGHAAQAFEILAAHKSGTPETRVDLILMDVMMPDISGTEACRRVKSDEALKDIPVLMVTARTDLECFEEAFNAGAMDYIVKPVRKIELLARVGSALKLKKEMDDRKLREKDLTVQNEKLEKALTEIKVLRGFLPICAYCKKIRDVKGLWHQMEAYLMSHSELTFTHGICEACLKNQHEQLSIRKTKPHPND